MTPNILYSREEDFKNFSNSNRVIELIIVHHNILLPDYEIENERQDVIQDIVNYHTKVPEIP